MKTSFLCVPCFFRQAEQLLSLVRLSSEKKRIFFQQLTKALLKYDFRNPPVVFGRFIYKKFSQISGIRDPFKKEKERIERFLKNFIPQVEGILRNSKDPLLLASKLSCLGNAIDFGAGRPPVLNSLKNDLKTFRFRVNHFVIFREKIKKAKILLVLADNVGETFFDRIFLKEIKEKYPHLEIFYAVRSSPIINDACIPDAKKAEIDSFAKIISSGCDYPGIIISKTSSLFRKIYRKADVIVSKGQGNFESFVSYKDTFYIFKIKCKPVSEEIGLSQQSFLFLYNKYKKRIS